VRWESEFSAFCAGEHPRLVGALSLYCGDPAVAEELAQDALARACRDWNRVRRLAAPGAWVHRVAINLAHSHFRRKGAEARAGQRVHSMPGSEQQFGGDHDTALTIRSAVASLPQRQRVAVVLRYYLDLPVGQVALIMQCPEGTVKTLTSKAISSLRRTLSADLKEARDAF
jgi:RNA polymerase sigma-70 factor (sigma-E family)